MIQWLTCLITGRISVFEWISWINDSKTNAFLTAPFRHLKNMCTQELQFYTKYTIPDLQYLILGLIFDSQPCSDYSDVMFAWALQFGTPVKSSHVTFIYIVLYAMDLFVNLYFVSYPYDLQKEMLGRMKCHSVNFSYSKLNVISFCMSNIFICIN